MFFCLQICVFGLNISVFCLQIRIFGLKIRIIGPKMHIIGLNIQYAFFLYLKKSGDYFSTCRWTDSPCRWNIRIFVSSFCQYLPRDWHSVPLDCLSHRYGTLQKRSTGQMKYRWETLTSELDMKTLILWTKTLPRKY